MLLCDSVFFESSYFFAVVFPVSLLIRLITRSKEQKLLKTRFPLLSLLTNLSISFLSPSPSRFLPPHFPRTQR